MPNLFRKDNQNPWLESQRQEVRRVIIAVVLFTAVVLGGFGWLIYAFLDT